VDALLIVYVHIDIEMCHLFNVAKIESHQLGSLYRIEVSLVQGSGGWEVKEHGTCI
jgi:hypothetical protein